MRIGSELLAEGMRGTRGFPPPAVLWWVGTPVRSSWRVEVRFRFREYIPPLSRWRVRKRWLFSLLRWARTFLGRSCRHLRAWAEGGRDRTLVLGGGFLYLRSYHLFFARGGVLTRVRTLLLRDFWGGNLDNFLFYLNSLLRLLLNFLIFFHSFCNLSTQFLKTLSFLAFLSCSSFLLSLSIFLFFGSFFSFFFLWFLSRDRLYCVG